MLGLKSSDSLSTALKNFESRIRPLWKVLQFDGNRQFLKLSADRKEHKCSSFLEIGPYPSPVALKEATSDQLLMERQGFSSFVIAQIGLLT